MKALAEPLVTVISPMAKLDDDSPNATVTLKLAALVGLVAAVLSVMPGDVRSDVMLKVFETVFALPAASVKVPAATLTVTVPSAAGVTMKL